jgi:predicted adenylyl cyclase CyaB
MLNIEFKAKVNNLYYLENKLQTLQPKFIGKDHQIDTYFNTKENRLKLREGNIENALIHYKRENTASSKLSEIILYNHIPNLALKQILTETLGVKAIVDKQRKIYFIENVKFHFDNVIGLGNYIEVEAIDEHETLGKEKLQQQCDFYFNFFDLKEEQLQQYSYSDMVLLSKNL